MSMFGSGERRRSTKRNGSETRSNPSKLSSSKASSPSGVLIRNGRSICVAGKQLSSADALIQVVREAVAVETHVNRLRPLLLGKPA